MYYSLLVLLTTISFSSTALNVKFGARTARQASVTTNCTTVDNGSGICIYIKKCDYIMNLLRNNRSDPNVSSYLLKSKCGGSGTNILVCCNTNETEYRFDGVSVTEPTETSDETVRLPSQSEGGSTEVPDIPKIVEGQPSVSASVTTNCTTVGYGSGICIHIKNCDYIMKLLRNNKSDPNVRSYLLKAKCGGSGTNILVCCSTNEADYRFDEASVTQPTQTIDESMRLPSPPECGISEVRDVPRIVGGQPAVPGEWPWLAALGYTTTGKNPERVWRCGGSLINRRYVITAAHCINSTGLTVEVIRLGELDLKNDNDGSLHVDYGIEKVIIHDEYQSAIRPDDIALIKLDKEVSYTRFIKPICLPTPEMTSKTFESFSPFIAGWGTVRFNGASSNHLLQTQVKVVPNYECQQAYISKNTPVTTRQICAGFKNKLNDACKGDSGGPLMWPEGRTYYIIGLVSFGVYCGHPSYPTVYTRVSSYVKWITDKIQ